MLGSGRSRRAAGSRLTVQGEKMMEQQVQDPVPRVVDHVGFAVAN